MPTPRLLHLADSHRSADYNENYNLKVCANTTDK